MSSEVDVKKTLRYQLEAYNTAYPIDIAYPNAKYSPTVGTDYLQVDYLFAVPAQAGIGTESLNRYIGVFQIIIDVKIDNGEYEADNIFKQLREYFKRGTRIIYNNIGVSITRIGLGGYDYDETWYRQVVNIGFRSDIEN